MATSQKTIDLLLTDLMLSPPGFHMISTGNPYPGVHGHEVIQRTLAMKRTFRVILISSLSAQDRKAYRIGTDQVPFLQKPFSVETLIQLVHAVFAAAPLAYDDSPASRAPRKPFVGTANLARHVTHIPTSQPACGYSAFVVANYHDTSSRCPSRRTLLYSVS